MEGFEGLEMNLLRPGVVKSQHTQEVNKQPVKSKANGSHISVFWKRGDHQPKPMTVAYELYAEVDPR